MDLENHGYVLLDITPARLQGAFWYVDTITERNSAERRAAATASEAGASRLRPVDISSSQDAGQPQLEPAIQAD